MPVYASDVFISKDSYVIDKAWNEGEKTMVTGFITAPNFYNATDVSVFLVSASNNSADCYVGNIGYPDVMCAPQGNYSDEFGGSPFGLKHYSLVSSSVEAFWIRGTFNNLSSSLARLVAFEDRGSNSKILAISDWFSASTSSSMDTSSIYNLTNFVFIGLIILSVVLVAWFITKLI